MGSVVKQNLSRIQGFYKDKSIFLTGGTGFLGTALIEKLLRSCPDIRCIYLLVRRKNGITAENRLNELVKDPGFFRLKKEQPKFIEKLAIIQGDLLKPKLGINQKDQSLLRQSVDVVFHSAATVKFNEPLKVAVKTNLVPTEELCKLAQEIANLKSFVYLSTAYSNAYKEVIPEKVLPSIVAPDKLVSLVDLLDENELDKITPNLMYPAANTYTLSKGAAENVVSKYRSSLPIAILRPSFVGASADEPASGWINNKYQSISVMVYGVAAGRIHSLINGLDVQLNIVPVDKVVNTTIALSYAIAAHNWKHNKDVPVVNCVSKSYNSMTWRHFASLLRKHVSENPSQHLRWYPFLVTPRNRWSVSVCRTLLQDLPASVIDLVTAKTETPTKLKGYYYFLEKYEDVMEPAKVKTSVFEEKNADRLWDLLEPEDQQLFPFNMADINWSEYMRNVVLGCRRYLLREHDSTLERSRHKIKVLYVIHLMAQGALILMALTISWFIFV